jgi:outer membrane protein assembly factor BamD
MTHSAIRTLSHRRLLLCASLCLAPLMLLSGCGSAAKKANVTPEKLYEEARSDMDNGDYGNAVRGYELLESRFPFSNSARQGQLDLMYSYFKAREPESAEDQADQFIRENPAHPRVDYAYYVKGLVSFEGVPNFLERWFRADLSKRPPVDARKSFQAFQTLVQRFPNSPYASDSRHRMEFLRNRLANYEISVASYYLERGAYVGAINRCKYVLENYDGAPATREALRIMVQSYQQLGMPDLSANAAKVLNENFPGTPVVEVKDRWWRFW